MNACEVCDDYEKCRLVTAKLSNYVENNSVLQLVACGIGLGFYLNTL